MFYHGTGSENASRAYTETPMQHVQRTALRKKCMKSTFTLDCGKKHAFFPSLSVRLSSRLYFSLYICLSFQPLLFFHVLAKYRSLSLRFIGAMKRKRFVDSSTFPVTKRFWRLERFCSRHRSRFIHFCLRRSRKQEITAR